MLYKQFLYYSYIFQHTLVCLHVHTLPSFCFTKLYKIGCSVQYAYRPATVGFAKCQLSRPTCRLQTVSISGLSSSVVGKGIISENEMLVIVRSMPVLYRLKPTSARKSAPPVDHTQPSVKLYTLTVPFRQRDVGHSFRTEDSGVEINMRLNCYHCKIPV